MIEKKPIDPGMIARAAAGIRYAITGKAPAWFGPLDPIAPIVPDAMRESVVGRQFDYQTGYNVQQQPRSSEAVTFAQMRALADSYDLLRLVIETRKDQVVKLPWIIGPRDDDASEDDRSKKITEFFRSPDKEHDWEEWLRMLLEDLFVLDAPTVYPRLTNGGKLYALEAVDGATIKRVLSDTGRTPRPPLPAFQQVLKGVPAVDYTLDQLVYKPRNIRTHRVYGYSPVEQIIMTVNIALRRQIDQLSYYTEGNISNLVFGVPKEWSPDQISQFQGWWDSVTEAGSKHRARFVPDGVKPFETKTPPLKDMYDEWLARIVCFCFSISPAPFVAQVNRATAESAKDAEMSEGLGPIKSWVKSLIDGILVKYFDAADLELKWVDDADEDPLIQAQINKIYIDAKVLHPDEVRADLGRDPLTPEQMADLNPPPPEAVAPDGIPSPVDPVKVFKASKKKAY